MEPLAHASIGLMAKPIAPRAPLWALVAATQLPDLLYFGLNAAGIETPGVSVTSLQQGLEIASPPYYPWSHGLFMCIVWSVMLAAIAFLFSRDRRTSLVIGAMIFSHWVLDFIVYSTLPLLFENSLMVGLGLLHSGPGVAISIILELSLIVGGIVSFVLYRKRRTLTMCE